MGVKKVVKSENMLFILIALLSFVLQFFLPWWIIAVVAFGIAAWKGRSTKDAFFSGFAAIVLVWTAKSLFTHIQTEGILTDRIATLFNLPSPVLLIIVTALVGGLVGGIAALSGFFFRQLLVE